MVDAEKARRLPPLWFGNLLAFGLLIALVLVWFSAQSRQAQRAFEEEAGRQAGLLAQVVGQHARGAIHAAAVTDDVVAAFLGNAARFIDYLDDIEPFLSHELSAFAAETGLSVIRVVRDGGSVQGPLQPPLEALDCSRPGQLIALPDIHMLVLGVPRQGGDGCVLVAMDSGRMDELRREIGLEKALNGLAELPGVVRVAMDATVAVNNPAAPPLVRLRRPAGGVAVAETRTPVAGAWLELDLDAGSLLREEARLWRDFVVFSLLLGVFGALSTWLLFRHQQAHDRQLRAYEHKLSRRREEAGLGRAAAAIAHEIRNPLNAMGMGLQRLEMEAPGLDDEHRRLLTLVRESLKRTDKTVRGLLDYARPFRPQPVALCIDSLIGEQLELHQSRMEERAVQLNTRLNAYVDIAADPDLLRQLLGNLLRNALEALPDGGLLEIDTTVEGGGVQVRLSNEAADLSPGEAHKALEPWFTTKTDGTGLGLAISRRIAAAHGGDLRVELPRPGWFTVIVSLPETQHP